MQFSDTTNDTGLYQDALYLAGADTNNFPVKDFTRLANRWYYKAVVSAWKASSSWQYDDANNTGQPNATQNLVAGQKEYTLPTSALKIRSVVVLNNAGDWQTVAPITEKEIGQPLDEFMSTDGLPQYYRLIGDDVVLYPAPASGSVTTTNGLKIYFLRKISDFVSTDTTKEPSIAEPFHRILSLGSAYDFALAKGRQNMNILKGEVEQLLAELRQFYSRRHQDRRLKIRVRRQSYR